MAYTPSGNKSLTSGNRSFIGAAVRDGNQTTMQVGSNMMSEDATASPVQSPVTVNTTATLTVPNNAVAVIICSVTNPVQVSEDSTQTAYFALPAGVPQQFYCGRQQNIYLKTSGSTVVSFQFILV